MGLAESQASIRDLDDPPFPPSDSQQHHHDDQVVLFAAGPFSRILSLGFMGKHGLRPNPDFVVPDLQLPESTKHRSLCEIACRPSDARRYLAIGQSQPQQQPSSVWICQVVKNDVTDEKTTTAAETASSASCSSVVTRLAQEHKGSVSVLASLPASDLFSSSSRVLSSTPHEDRVSISDAQSGELICQLDTPFYRSAQIASMYDDSSPTLDASSLVFLGSGRGILMRCDLNTNKGLWKVTAWSETISGLDVDRPSREMVITSQRVVVRLWNLDGDRVLDIMHPERVDTGGFKYFSRCCYHADRNMVLVEMTKGTYLDNGGSVACYDIRKIGKRNKPLMIHEYLHSKWISRMRHLSGDRFVSAGRDGAVRVWNCMTGKVLEEFCDPVEESGVGDSVKKPKMKPISDFCLTRHWEETIQGMFAGRVVDEMAEKLEFLLLKECLKFRCDENGISVCLPKWFVVAEEFL